MAYIEIRPKRSSHANCDHGAIWEDGADGYMHQKDVRVGEVRRCQHGRVQVCYQIGYRSRYVVDVSTPLWRTLSRFWTPRLYREAVAALESTPPPAAVPSTLRKAWK